MIARRRSAFLGRQSLALGARKLLELILRHGFLHLPGRPLALGFRLFAALCSERGAGGFLLGLCRGGHGRSPSRDSTRERSTRCPGSEEATVIVISGSGFHPLAGAGAAAPFAGPDALARLQIEPVCEAAADLWPEIGREFIDCPTHEGLSDL